MSEGGRRWRVRGGDPGPKRAHRGKGPRNRLGSVSCSNEESTEGEDETVVRKVCVNSSRLKSDKDGRGGHTRKRSSRISNGLIRSTTAEEDVIDGFLFLSFSTIAEMEKDTKGSVDDPPDVGDILTDGAQEEETKEEEVVEAEIRNGISEHFAGLEPVVSKEHSNNSNPLLNGKDDEIGENNNEITTPNQNIVVSQPVVIMTPKSESLPLAREPLRTKEMNGSVDNGQPYKKICDTAEEAKKVPPDLEAPRPETPKQDAVPLPTKKSPSYPLKTTPSLYLPAQNGPNEPSAAVAAVTVPATSQPTVPSHPQPHQTTSTSPAGGVPFPTSLQDTFDKSHNSPPQQSNKSGSDAAHPYPVCASYSDYTVSYSYSSKHQQYQESGQRAHGKVVTNNSYYNHHHPQDSSIKYQKEVGQRSNSNDSNCDGYENYHGGRYESSSKAAELSGYQAYEKSCDPACKKPSSNANSVYNFKTSQLLTNENVSKTGSEKVGGKVTGDLYSNVSKAKIPNRTTYYQSIVNKSHSRHKSSRRVLPASAYENTKQVINNYPSSKSELAQVQPSKTVQYTPHHYSTENKKHDYYQPLSVANTGTTNTYNCSTYKTDPSQTHVNNSSGHSNYPSESQSSGSRNYKTSTDHLLGSYRDKQPLPPVGSTSTKSYSYHNSRNHVDASSNKVSADTVPGYGNSDYYHKGSVNYSRSAGVNPSAISDSSYKNSNHSSDHSTVYQSKNSSYHLSRTSSEKGGRNYYSNQEGSYKSYRQDLVPKTNSDETHGYRSTHEGIPYLNHGNSSSSLKSKEILAHSVVEPLKTAPVEPVRSIPTEANSIHPPNGDNSTHQLTTPRDTRDTKPTFYPYAEPSHYNHQRTPPLPSSKQQPYEQTSPTKDPEAFRLSSTSAISSYPQPRPTTPQDISRNGTTTTKTLWSPTATTTTVSATSREIVAASSRDSHSSHSNSSISSLSQLSQSLGPQAKEPASKEFLTREGGRSSSNGHSRSSSGNETPVYSSAAAVTTTSTNSSSTAIGVSGSLTSLIFSKASWTSPSVSSVLTSPSSSHFSSAGPPGSSPVPSVLPLAPSLPSSSHTPFGPPGGPHVMFAPPLPHTPAGPSPLAAAAGPSPFAGDSLFAPPPPPPSTDLLNIRRELDTRFLASQDRSIAVPPPPYLRAEMHQHQHQHTHMHQHSPFLPPPLGITPPAHPLYDKFPKVDSSFYGRNALGIPTYPISPLLAPGSATATPTPFAPPGHMAAFQPKISPLVKAKTLKSGRWCAMHVRISWEIYRHQQKHQDPQKAAKGVGDLLRPPNHLFGALPRPHEMGFAPSPLMGAAGSIHARSPYDVSPQHPAFLGPTPAHLGISPFSRPNYPSIGVPGNSFGGLGGLGLTGAAGMLAGARGAELGPGGYLGLDPWGRLHRTPPNFPSPSSSSVGGPGGSWGGLKAEADRMQQKRSEDHHERDKQKRAEVEKKESDKSKEMARESKKEHDKQKERDREGRVSHVSNHPEPLRNGDTTTTDSRSTSNNHRDWERSSRDRTRDSSRSPHRPHKPQDDKDVKVKEEDKSASPIERTTKPDPPPDNTPLDYLSRFPMVPQIPFWNHPDHRYLQQLDREQLMQKYASLSTAMPPLERSFREAELARHLSSEAAAREIERQLQADRDRQLFERGKIPPLRPNEYGGPAAGLFPHLPFMGGGYQPKSGSPSNGVPPPLIPCQSPGVTPPLKDGREHYAKASHEGVESQSR